MSERTDYDGLQRLSALEWENERVARIHALSRSLTGVGDSARALPTSCADIHRHLAAIDDAILTELGRQFSLENPFPRR